MESAAETEIKDNIISTLVARYQPVVNGKIQVHPNTGRPSELWEELKVNQVVKKVPTLSPDEPINQRKIRFVCISDTHDRRGLSPSLIPKGDVLLHTGDFSMVGHPDEIESFNQFLGSLPHKHKIVIAGNHDLTFDPDFLEGNSLRRFGFEASAVRQYMAAKGISKMAEVLTNCTAYLEDTETTVCGIRIYGTPWQPRLDDMGFNLDRGEECLKMWDLIPEGIDILMTHGPPLGHGDLCCSGEREGCVELLHTIQHRVKPKYHVFGHTHEGYGVTSDGVTTYINSAICSVDNVPSNRCIVFDLPLPEGQTKEALEENHCTDHLQEWPSQHATVI